MQLDAHMASAEAARHPSMDAVPHAEGASGICCLLLSTPYSCRASPSICMLQAGKLCNAGGCMES